MRVKFAVQERFLVVQVAFDLAIRVGVVRKDRAVHTALFLVFQPRLVEGGTECHVLEDSPRLPCLFAGFQDGGVDLHRLSIFAPVSPAGHDHLFHQHPVGEEFVEQCLAGIALLGKLCQPGRGTMPQDSSLHELAVQGIAGEQSGEVGQ